MCYIRTNPTAFHMPGHKLGKGIPREFLDGLFQWDLTEIPGTDNLHFPEGAIKEAQELAAEAFGADRTYFLVNGSTCGIHAAIMTVCKPGDKLIVSRDCHKAVIHGMMLAGAEPVYIKPEYDMNFGISTVIEPDELDRVLSQNPEAAGVLITRPNYYGICSDIESIAAIVHSHGKVLIVDEAHGAHLKFNGGLPICAMQAGADICVQSAHKTLPALTQGAYLHTKSCRIDEERLRLVLQMIQTSSPSYVIMAFLDIAREIMQAEGGSLLDHLLQNTQWLDGALRENGKLVLLKEEHLKSGTQDKTRAVINVRGIGKSGFDVDRMLRKEFNIQVEMADLYNIVCIGTIADQKSDFEKLYAALKAIAGRSEGVEPFKENSFGAIQTPRQKMKLRDVLGARAVGVKLEKAIGGVSKSIITPYPPGIPVICPGEEITEEAVAYLSHIIRSGGTVNGLCESGEISIVRD